MIAHPPCTYLSRAGLRWCNAAPAHPKPGVLYGEERKRAMHEAAEFARALYECSIPRVAVENPRGMLTSLWRKSDQVIQPWQFGHGEVKATCLWLKNLPLLQPTQIVEGREARVWKMPPSADRWKLRSVTLEGIAKAMAEQWGSL